MEKLRKKRARMTSKFCDTSSHFAVELDDFDKKWLDGIMESLARNTLSFETAKLAAELAFKKGYAKGQHKAGKS